MDIKFENTKMTFYRWHYDKSKKIGVESEIVTDLFTILNNPAGFHMVEIERELARQVFVKLGFGIMYSDYLDRQPTKISKG